MLKGLTTVVLFKSGQRRSASLPDSWLRYSYKWPWKVDWSVTVGWVEIPSPSFRTSSDPIRAHAWILPSLRQLTRLSVSFRTMSCRRLLLLIVAFDMFAFCKWDSIQKVSLWFWTHISFAPFNGFPALFEHKLGNEWHQISSQLKCLPQLSSPIMSLCWCAMIHFREGQTRHMS